MNVLSRAHLETLSSADLIALADDYGIDIPDDLNRRFIIGELMEVGEELEQDSSEKMTEIDAIEDDSLQDTNVKKSTRTKGLDILTNELPKSFNETQIDLVLRNPAWAFVFWDICTADETKIKEEHANLFLRVSYFLAEDSDKPETTFDLNAAKDDKSQFVMLSAAGKFVRIDLVSKTDYEEDTLAISRRFFIQKGSPFLYSIRPGFDIKISPALELSGIRDVLKVHYDSHRESFA